MMRLFPFLSVCCGVAMLMQPVMAEPLVFLGEDISAQRNTVNCIVAMQLCWKQDIEASRQNDMLCTLGESEVQAAYAALNDYVQAASEAQAALVNFAVCSMTPLRASQPELYRRALMQYRQALDILFLNDMQQLRLHSVLTPSERSAGITPVHNALGEAVQRRINRNWDTFRSAKAEYHQFREDCHRRQVEFVLNLLAGDRLPCEFITNIPLADAPMNYADNCKARFLTAYAAWQKYADCAARMHCPVPALQGNDTPATMTDQRLILQTHFEQFLALLIGGLGR